MRADDGTRAVLRLLHRRRREHGRRGNTLYGIYVGVLLVAVYGVPYLIGVARLAGPNAGTPAALRLTAALPSAVPTLLLTVWLLAARDGLWRGPVSPPAALVDWLLPTPLSRARLLGRSYATSLLVTVLAATAAGALAGAGVAAGGAGEVAALLGGGALTGLVTGLIATGTGLAVQRWSPPGRVTAAWTATAWLLVALGALATALAARSGHAAWPGSVAAWSGPWGWAAQPLLLAAGTSGPAGSIATVGAVLAGLTGLASLAAVAWVPDLRLEDLRRRARSVQQVAGAVLTLDWRQARLGGRAAAADRGLPVRLPVPPVAGAAIAWRDASYLLRFPGRLAGSAAAAAAATVLLAWSASAPADVRGLLALLGWVAFYLAGAQLLETARLDADVPGRAAPLAPGLGSVALRHAVVPGCLLAASGLVAEVVTRHVAGATPVELLAPAALVTVAAGLVSAYRGPLPPGLLVGAQTPLGDTGMAQVALWYLRGALLMIGVMTVLTLNWLHHPAPDLGAVPVGAGVAGLLWARGLAAKLARPA